MSFYSDIGRYTPINAQEAADQALMLDCIARYPDTVLTRENPLAHITSSGFVLGAARTKALLVHHNILKKWAWTGGHADGDGDLLAVALREAAEETGAAGLRPLGGGIASLDILPVPPHQKNGRYVNAHLHLSVAYLLEADESAPLRSRPGENTGAAWFALDYFTARRFNEYDTYLYNKLIDRAKRL